MSNETLTNNRISFDDGFHMFSDKYVLLGFIEEQDGNIISGIPIATAERHERDYIWDLFTQYLNQNKYGELFLNYFGDIESTGVYL